MKKKLHVFFLFEDWENLINDDVMTFFFTSMDFLNEVCPKIFFIAGWYWHKPQSKSEDPENNGHEVCLAMLIGSWYKRLGT